MAVCIIMSSYRLIAIPYASLITSFQPLLRNSRRFCHVHDGAIMIGWGGAWQRISKPFLYNDVLLREWEMNPWKKSRDPAGIQTKDLLITSQTLLPFWGVEDTLHYISSINCLEASVEFQLILTLSELDWFEFQLDPGFLSVELSQQNIIIHEHLLLFTIITSSLCLSCNFSSKDLRLEYQCQYS